MKSYFAGFTAIVLATIIWFQFSKKPEPAPDVSLQLLNAPQKRLSDYRGQVLLVNFWSTSCPPCFKEMEDFKTLYPEFQQQGFEIIGVAMPYDRPDMIAETKQRKALPYPVALDITGEVFRAFGSFKAVPTSFLISKHGLIIEQHTGLYDINELRNKIKQQLSI